MEEKIVVSRIRRISAYVSDFERLKCMFVACILLQFIHNHPIVADHV